MQRRYFFFASNVGRCARRVIGLSPSDTTRRRDVLGDGSGITGAMRRASGVARIPFVPAVGPSDVHIWRLDCSSSTHPPCHVVRCDRDVLHSRGIAPYNNQSLEAPSSPARGLSSQLTDCEPSKSAKMAPTASAAAWPRVKLKETDATGRDATHRLTLCRPACPGARVAKEATRRSAWPVLGRVIASATRLRSSKTSGCPAAASLD